MKEPEAAENTENPEEEFDENGKESSMSNMRCSTSEQPEGPDPKYVSPHDIRVKLLQEKRKKFAKKWFTKFNMYKKNIEN